MNLKNKIKVKYKMIYQSLKTEQIIYIFIYKYGIFKADQFIN